MLCYPPRPRTAAGDAHGDGCRGGGSGGHGGQGACGVLGTATPGAPGLRARHAGYLEAIATEAQDVFRDYVPLDHF